MRELPVEDKGEINKKKLGWILSKNANRIVNGLEFKEAQADGRKAWAVIPVKTPVLPVWLPSVTKSVTPIKNIIEVEI